MRARKCLLRLSFAALLLLGVAVQGHATPPPAPWIARDIGRPIAPGSVDVDLRQLWTVRAANGDIGMIPKKLDDFFFVYQPLSGDGSILALLTAQEGGDPTWAKAGVMLRENETTGARNLFLGITTGKGMLFSFRPVARKSTAVESGAQWYGPRRFPTWLRLQREGDRFTPFSSPDGFGWVQLRSPLLLSRFANVALAGLATSAFQSGVTTAAFTTPIVVPGLVSPIVQVCSTNGAVLLTWPPVASALGYVVRRSAPNTPGFAADLLTPQPIKETSFADTGLTNGQPIRYLVSAVYDQGGQALEGWATAVLALPVPTPGNLYGCDINLEATQLRGGILFDPASGNYKIFGAGGDIWNTEDRCFYASRLVMGDFQITARILDRPSQTSIVAKAGLMVRESLDGPSRMIFLGATAGNGLRFQYRTKTGGQTTWPGKPVIADKRFKLPLFLRLVRQGATITASFSADGKTFTPAGKPQRFDPPLAGSLYAGYAITSQNPGAVATNTFSDLSLGPLPAP